MMSNITSIYHAVEFIEAHLTQPISIADVADAASYSVYHFCRKFNEAVHHSPYDYLMRRRLSESARELVETDKRITDIAFDYQFNSPETFSRAFKRMFGTQPNRWKKQAGVDRRVLMSRLSLAHIQHRNRGDCLRPVFEEREAFQVAGVVSLVRQDAQVIFDLWDILARELGDLAGQVEHYYGVTAYPQDWQSYGCFYMAAAQIEAPGQAGPGLVVKTIPASTYARFIHKGPYQDLELTLDYVYQTGLPKSGKRLSCPLEIEYHGRGFGPADPAQSGFEILIPIE